MSIETIPKNTPAGELSTGELIQRRKQLHHDLHELSKLLEQATRQHNDCIIKIIVAKSIAVDIISQPHHTNDLSIELLAFQLSLDTATSRYNNCIATITATNEELTRRRADTWNLGRELEVIPAGSAADGYGKYDEY